VHNGEQTATVIMLHSVDRTLGYSPCERHLSDIPVTYETHLPLPDSRTGIKV